jgi:amino acid adenylation domain-containing protein
MKWCKIDSREGNVAQNGSAEWQPGINATSLYDELCRLDVKIWAEGDKLRVSAPKGALTDTLRAALVEQKADLLLLVRERSAIPRRSQNEAQLSFAQQRLWFLEQLQPGMIAYNLAQVLRLTGHLDESALERAINALVDRHEVLRTAFRVVGGTPVQIVVSKREITLPVVDLSHVPIANRDAEARSLALAEVHRRFDLTVDGLIRPVLYRFAPDEHVLCLTMHHIVTDGWSLAILTRQLGDAYAAYSDGRPLSFPDLPIQYADYSQWQRAYLQGTVLERELAYWRNKLAGFTSLDLATDRPRPAVQSYAGAHYRFSISNTISDQLRGLSRSEGVTLFMTLLAAFKVLLARYTGQEDIVIGSPVAGRTRQELEGLIGIFVNTLPLRTDLSGDPSFRDLLKRVKETCLDAYAHQEVPFEKLVEELRPERDLSRNPIFQVVLALQNVPRAELTLGGVLLSPVDFDRHAAQFDLTLFLFETNEGLKGAIEYSTDLFEASTIERMVGHFQVLLENISTDPDQVISRVGMLTAKERQWLIHDLNATRTLYPRDHRIHELFEMQAAQTPQAIALVQGDRSLTYGEVNRRANAVAHRIRELGVARGDVVGIWMRRSPELVVGLLGVLKAGAAYAPFDLASPPERMRLMLEDAKVSVLVTDPELAARLPGEIVRAVCLTPGTDELGTDGIDANPVSAGGPLDLAYVMYTSGSTGRPKGVAVPHRAVVRLVKNTNYAHLSADQVFLQLAPVSFDASTLEIWGALLNGARLVLFPGEIPSLDQIAGVLEQHQVTILWLTAGLFHQVVEERIDALRTIRQLLAGGDVLSAPHVRQVLARVPGCRVINGYGPTENTTFTCCHSMTDAARVGANVPIGRPIANTRVYILDRHMQPVPVGVRGELWAGGDGLAIGYLNRPDLTSERFVPCPHADAPGELLYRTGDFARYLSDGTIQFLGRSDDQVKIRGFRIELGEVEAGLMRHPAVRQAVVVVRDEPATGKRLVAYLMAEPEERINARELRTFLKASLPDYMIPSAFIWLDEFPLTPNGKVDRRALPAPKREVTEETAEATRAPWNELEVRLARLWEDTLSVKPVGRHDNFFDLGGHSLLAARLFARLEKEFHRKLPLSVLFEAPTVAEMAALIQEEGWSASWRSLVPIQPKGSRPPLFALPGVGGNVIGYLQLAELLGKDQPFYGLQARGLDGKERPLTSMEEIAAHHVTELRTVQPHGPYFLLGLCVGGVIAYEMAQQLVRDGEKIGMLGMLDTWPGAPARRIRTSPLVDRGVVFVRLVFRRLKDYSLTFARLPMKERWRFIANRISKVKSMAAERNPLGDAGHEFSQTIIERANVRALDKYVIRPYPGQILYFFAENRRVRIVRGDARSVWRRSAGGGYEQHTLPTDDSGKMLNEPHVRVLAKHLRAYLDREADKRAEN